MFETSPVRHQCIQILVIPLTCSECYTITRQYYCTMSKSALEANILHPAFSAHVLKIPISRWRCSVCTPLMSFSLGLFFHWKRLLPSLLHFRSPERFMQNLSHIFNENKFDSALDGLWNVLVNVWFTSRRNDELC